MAQVSARARRSVVITGANGGIGRAIAQRLAGEGWRVFAGARTPQAVDELAELGHEQIVPVALDVTDDEGVASLPQRLGDLEDGALHGLVNCAGIIVDGPLELLPPEHVRRGFDVNVVGACSVTRALLPALRRGRGRVVNVGAVSSRTTAPFFGAIAATKAALASINDAMRMEFAPFGVDVVLVEPGGIQTGIWATAAALRARSFAAQRPELVALYQPALDAVQRAFAQMEMDRPAVVAHAVVRALTSTGTPKPRVLVGKGAAQFALLGRLPIPLRDRLLMTSLGLA